MALLLQQGVPEAFLTKVANKLRELRKEIESSIQTDNIKGISFAGFADKLDLDHSHFGSDCIHLNQAGHKYVASKLSPAFKASVME